MSTAPRSQQEPILRRHDQQGITTLTLNRPQQFNALSEELLSALQLSLDAIAEDRTVRVVIIAGAGRAFCAGHDLRQMRSQPSRAYYEALFAQCSRVMLSLVRLPQPVIARVHGIATAAGCQLVATCDLAVAAASARFAVSGVNLGLFCSTPAVALARNLARKRAFEMLVMGEFIDAEAALSYGLLNRVVADEELDAAVAAYAQAVVQKSAVAIRFGKKAFYQQLGDDLEAAYRQAVGVMACNMQAEDAAEGIDAFLDRRAPTFRGR
jgi:enoyl-CoA hydratase/carnithine racemase